MDEDLIGYAVLASPPSNYGEVIMGVTGAIEKLERTLRFETAKGQPYRRGDFRTVTFGCSYGGGQKVIDLTGSFF